MTSLDDPSSTAPSSSGNSIASELDDTIQLISEGMHEFRGEMERINVSATKISARTTYIIRGTLVILIFAFGYVFFQVIHLTDTMIEMIGSMNTMYTQFGGMSRDMRGITVSVVSIGGNVTGMPAIAVDMQAMNRDVQGMRQSVKLMTDDIDNMDKEIDFIRGGTQQMAGRFVNVNNSVSHMNYNVRQMSRPTDWLGPLNWFTPP